MSQTISALMRRDVACVGPDDTLQAVEALMVARDLSWVPVVEGGSAVLGVISSTDLLRCHAEGKDPLLVCAWQICTYKPIVVSPDTPLGEVARRMVESKVHHVVVADETGLKGVVSSFDFVRTFMV